MYKDQAKIHQLELELKNLEIQMTDIQRELDKENTKPEAWFKGKDKKVIQDSWKDKIKIDCEYIDWEFVKKELENEDRNDIFSITITEYNHDEEMSTAVVLGIEQAKEIANHLNKIINYLEGDE